MGTDLTPEVLEKIGKAFGTWVKSNSGSTVVVGRDNRASSLAFQESLMLGLRSTGCNVLDIGLSTTPVMNFTVLEMDLDGGISITGSHNPLEFNGIKFSGSKGYTLTENDIQDIRNSIELNDFLVGHGEVSLWDPKPRYFAKLEELCHPQKSMRVVIDCGNGVASVYAPEVMHRLGHNTIELYCDLDSTFPHHLPNPEIEDNVRDLRNHVVNNAADLGIAFDGDCDRLGIVDEKGKFYQGDYTIILLSRDLLARHPGAKILVDIKCSQNVLDDITRHGGVPVLWKTGYTFIRRKMREENLLLAGEESGHMFFGENYYQLDDGLLAACRVLQILSASELPLSEQFADLPQLHATPLIQVPMADAVKSRVVEEVQRELVRSDQVNKIIDIDGVRASFEKGWALVRASNTSPNLTLRFEASSLDRLKTIEQFVFNVLVRVSPVKINDWRVN